jgi:tripartite-type tricarboxylate transporter receptor subunit TctC
MLSRVAAALLAIAVATGAANAAWPEKPITLLVPWAAGGGTDAVARILAAGLEKELGQPVNVVNRVGAGGVIAHNAMATAAPDGYIIGMATAEFSTYYWGALSETTYKDVTPIALVNFDPAAFHVSTTSPWGSFKEAIEAIRKAPPGTYKLGGVPIGAGWHLALGGFLKRRRRPVGLDRRADARRRARLPGACGGRRAYRALLPAGGPRDGRGGQGQGARHLLR